MQFERLAEAIRQYHPNPDLAIVQRAYEFAEKAHRGQVRASGEPYVNHLIETALLVAQLKLDVPSVTAALLHDTIEDCVVTRETLEKEFGNDVADIVDGVTKLTRTEFESREVRQAESFRKMLIAMAKDIRVVLVKLCDRLHNMRTLQYLPEQRRRFRAQETSDIYAPLANRLGIHWLKSELEDLCLLYLRPEIYKLIDENFRKAEVEQKQYVEETSKLIAQEFEKNGLAASVRGRFKHYYSIWRKMEDSNLTFEEIHDLIGFRVIVPTVRACYEGLGVVHATWKPVMTRFKDYIAMPKPNMYQSLHTTVIGPSGQRIEIQIRTPEMNRVAEEGIAAHWRYKEGKHSSDHGFDLQWVTELVETQAYLKNPDEFLQSVKGELFPEDVFVFTPKGDLIRLPFGSTIIDFAYHVHTDVGNTATGGRCNGQIVPIDYKLQNGDTIEVITAKNHVPNKDWLDFVRTTKAKQKIRGFLKIEERSRSEQIGEELLSKELRKVRVGLKKLEKDGVLLRVTESFGMRTLEELYAAIGYGKLAITKVLAAVLPDTAQSEQKLPQASSPLERIFQRAAKSSRQKVGVKVSGLDDILVRFARCCEPLPGDRIVGFITRGRGVTVHLANCAQVMKMDTMRQVDVVWDMDVKTARRVRITVHSQDQMGLLANVTSAITSNGANIANAQVTTTNYGKAINSFELMIDDARQLEKIIRAIEMVPGVIRVERVRQMLASISVSEN
jgi:guanosine-3',5'-bis(diphosphate) 3'-pyrophosphohydrolase